MNQKPFAFNISPENGPFTRCTKAHPCRLITPARSLLLLFIEEKMPPVRQMTGRRLHYKGPGYCQDMQKKSAAFSIFGFSVPHPVAVHFLRLPHCALAIFLVRRRHSPCWTDTRSMYAGCWLWRVCAPPAFTTMAAGKRKPILCWWDACTFDRTSNRRWSRRGRSALDDKRKISIRRRRRKRMRRRRKSILHILMLRIFHYIIHTRKDQAQCLHCPSCCYL